MSVLLGRDTRVIVQGLGREGRFHAERMKEYGTKVVGGTKPGAGGTSIDGIPMFDTVAAAVDATGANASIVFVPAAAAMDALLEAIDAQIDLVIAITEGIPIADMLKVRPSWRPRARPCRAERAGRDHAGAEQDRDHARREFLTGGVGFVSRSGRSPTRSPTF